MHISQLIGLKKINKLDNIEHKHTIILCAYNLFEAIACASIAMIKIFTSGEYISTIALLIASAAFLSINILSSSNNNSKSIRKFTHSISLCLFTILPIIVKPQTIILLISLAFPTICAMVQKKLTAFLLSTLLVTIQFAHTFYSYYINKEISIDQEFLYAYAATCIALWLCFSMISDLIRENENKNIREISKREIDIKNKQEFISNLSHQIRTPLNNILGIANILNDNISEKNRPLFESIIASVKNITNIVQSIDDESSAKNQPQIKTTIETFDLPKLIDETSAIFNNNIKIKLTIPANMPKLTGNAVKVRQVFLSVFDFFGKYTSSDICYLTININRVRIPETPIKYRFDVSTNSPVNIPEDGNILELNMTQQLISTLGGSMKKRFDEKSTFLYFNICFNAQENTTQITTPKDTTAPTVITTKTSEGYIDQPTITDLSQADVLVVEDNIINQKVMSLSLEKHVKTVDLAFNGQDGVDKIKRNHYDLVLMDIQMPVMDGYEATRAIRNEETGTTRHLPIIAVTAFTLAADRQKCKDAGMDDYVSKPFNIDEVLNKMKKALGIEKK